METLLTFGPIVFMTILALILATLSAVLFKWFKNKGK